MARRAWIVGAGLTFLVLVAPGFAHAQFGGGGLGQNIFGQAMRSTQQPRGKAPTESVAEVKKKMDDIDPRVRVAALDQLQTANTPDANSVLMQGMTDPDLRVKIKAIDILGAHQHHDAVAMMSQELFLRDTPAVVRMHLVAALGRIGDPLGTLPVMQYLDRANDERSRGTAVFALGEIGDPRSADKLTEIVAGDNSGMVRRLAQEALAKVNGELPSVHSEELAAQRNEEKLPTYDRLSKLREFDQKLREQNY